MNQFTTPSADPAPSLHDRLAVIQRDLHAPKSQRNDFGNYNYRNCEDILAAVKPLLQGLVITIHDEMVAVGDRVYVKATASITDGASTIACTGFAREAASKKGMDDSQVTGSTSSYARKYALNGLLLIDDTRDADSRDNREAQQQKLAPAQAAYIGNLLSQASPTTANWFQTQYGRPELVPREAYDQLCAKLKAAIAKAQEVNHGGA